ncbi:30S ribosomal protein S16 [Nitritalea halalkaliphila LW7]|uniref:30S ribosomal protein S16 n=1 Tax=Nitritalea halalkaliphila LW7 TaxID=1189621 RepID=I5CA80_9BACT|nr:30S ribosomal protein S16 [Nitritalea halalkaliphila LW7]
MHIGVLKGALTQEQADAKFQAWVDTKEGAITGKVDKIAAAKAEAKAKALEAEAAKNQARLDAIKKRQEEAAAAEAAANAPAEEASAEGEEGTAEA